MKIQIGLLLALSLVAGCAQAPSQAAAGRAEEAAAAQSSGGYTFHGYAQPTEAAHASDLAGVYHLGVTATSWLKKKDQPNPYVASVDGAMNWDFDMVYMGRDGVLYTRGKYQKIGVTPDEYDGGPVVEGYFRVGTFSKPTGNLTPGQAVAYRLDSMVEQFVPGPFGCCGSENVLFGFNTMPQPIKGVPEFLRVQ